jgi:molybdopterin molybdotransferase
VPLLSRDEAWARIAALAEPLPEQVLPLDRAVGRVLARSVSSPIDIPGFDRSAMDGWAVRSADTAGRLRVVGEVAAGAAGDRPVGEGEAVRIFTGGAIPPGADAVERQEVVTVHPDGTIELAEAILPGQNVRYRGEDVPAGTELMPAGATVTIQSLTALAGAGLSAVAVHRPARVAVLLTGDELVAPGRPLGPGQIHETSGVTLRSLATRAGAEVVDLGTAPDDLEATTALVRRALDEADVLLVAGGVSVGEHDHVKGAFEAAGVEELFWGVRIKPGKPLFCGRRADRWAFGLPGNPLSGVCSFLVFVEPLLRRMHGEAGAAERRVRVRTTLPIDGMDGRTTYLTARMVGPGEAEPTEQQGSAMTLALARADLFLIADGPIGAGEEVDALPL